MTVANPGFGTAFREAWPDDFGVSPGCVLKTTEFGVPKKNPRGPATSELIGYRRVGSQPPFENEQLTGIKPDRVIVDEADGKTHYRPALDELLEYARTDDVVVVQSMDRIATNIEQMHQIVESLVERGATVRFLREDLTFTYGQTENQAIIMKAMQAFAEFERALRKERQAEGIALAKRRGVYTGRTSSLTKSQATEIRRRAADGESKTSLAREFGVNRSTIYERLAAN